MNVAHGASTVLHLAPHPDDELIGAPAALMALRDAGWQVVNLACSLGSPGDAERRRSELTEACRRAGFACEVAAVPLGDPLGPTDIEAATRHLQSELAQAMARHRPRLVVAPSPHDRHPGHEVVGRIALQLCAAQSDTAPERLWLWGLWADLPFPSLLVGFDEERLAEILAALEAHGQELARNDYRRLVRGRAEMNASLGPERVFGFGNIGASHRYAEVVCEVGRRAESWRLGAPRWLDPSTPIGALGDQVLDGWLAAESITHRFGPPGGTLA